MRCLLKMITVAFIAISISGCCERRCGICKPVPQELPSDVQQKFEKMKLENGDK